MDKQDLIKKYVPLKKQSKAIKKLNKGYPVQYIIGDVEFYNCKLLVNKHVLIPRFETEYLIEKIITKSKLLNKDKLSIVDLGTGSGAISIALAKHIASDVTAYDISSKALKIAKLNAKNNNVNINFIKKDITKPITGKYDILVSNPPYIDYNEEVSVDVRKYEPHLALFAKDNGLYFYKQILSYANNNLNEKSILAFEIGHTQEKELTEVAKKYFPKGNISFEKDLTGKTRYLFIINE